MVYIVTTLLQGVKQHSTSMVSYLGTEVKVHTLFNSALEGVGIFTLRPALSQGRSPLWVLNATPREYENLLDEMR